MPAEESGGVAVVGEWCLPSTIADVASMRVRVVSEVNWSAHRSKSRAADGLLSHCEKSCSNESRNVWNHIEYRETLYTLKIVVFVHRAYTAP